MEEIEERERGEGKEGRIGESGGKEEGREKEGRIGRGWESES